MEDRLAKSLRAAHDRHVSHLAAQDTSHASHADHDASAPAQPPEHHKPVEQDSRPEHHPAVVHQAQAPAAETHPHTQAASHPEHHDGVSSHESRAPQPARPEALPVAAAAPARSVPSHASHAHPSTGGTRFNWRGSGVSIVGTLVLSILISTGLFSLQMLAKWRHATPAQPDVKVPSLDQPLTIADAQEDAPPTEQPAAAAVPAASPAHAAPVPANSEDSAQRGMDEFFAANGRSAPANQQGGESKAGRAPYAPDPIDLSQASATAVDNRTVAAPEAGTDHTSVPSGQPMVLPVPPANLTSGQAGREPKSTADGSNQPAPPRGLAGQPAAEAPVQSPEAGQPSTVYGVSERAAGSQLSAQRLSQSTATAAASPSGQPQEQFNPRNVTQDQWNRPRPEAAPAATASATQVPDVADAARNSLDAPGPVILPGRSTGASNSAAASATPSIVPTSGAASQRSDVVQADASPQLRDLTQRPGADAAPTPAATVQSNAGVDPIYGLFNRRPGAAAPEAAHPEGENGLAALDRTKVMSFQFRNAPWTVVLSQFAAETHLELRMQAVPQGVFNRWDAARYSPSQTLAILNSELSRTGCQLKLEGNVLRVTAVAPATTQAAPIRPAASSSPAPPSWLPQSSGIVPVSGRY